VVCLFANTYDPPTAPGGPAGNGTLPATGSPVAHTATAGLLFVAAGALLVVAASRRPRPSHRRRPGAGGARYRTTA
jgi:LPXTG-motif cell wall-anchored protein